MLNQTDNQAARTRPRAPAAYWWVVGFDLLHFGLLVFWLFYSPLLYRTTAPPWPVVVTGIVACSLAVTILLLSLRRGSFFGWVCQLVVLCLAVGLAPLPGILWVPLMVAWCGPETRDWFDPPMEREFG